MAPGAPLPPGPWEGAPGGRDRALTRRPLAAQRPAGAGGPEEGLTGLSSGNSQGFRALPGVLGQEPEAWAAR